MFDDLQDKQARLRVLLQPSINSRTQLMECADGIKHIDMGAWMELMYFNAPRRSVILVVVCTLQLLGKDLRHLTFEDRYKRVRY